METAVHQELTTTSPLSTISPRRIISSSAPTNPGDREDQQVEEKIQRQEQEFLQRLKARDREVRAHEAAHLAAGRPHILSGPSYTYQRGPDGRNYAIGGEVQLDVSEVRNDPEATITKAEQIRRAALAPAQPSPQDARVAANASQMAAQARVELAALRREESTPEGREQPGNGSIALYTETESGSNNQPVFDQFA